MTRMIFSTWCASIDQADEARRHAESSADVIELRVDQFPENDLPLLVAFLRRHTEVTWIVTRRSMDEGGRCADPPDRRAAFLAGVTRAGTHVLIDIEAATFSAAAEACNAAPPDRTILSRHAINEDEPSRAGVAAAEAAAMRRLRPGAIAKVAVTVTSAEEALVALDALRDDPGRTIALAMGEAGTFTRILARRLGAFGTFACRRDDKTAPGQLTVNELRDHYAWDRVTSATDVYGVIGDPVGHSLSPALMNFWFGRHGVDAVYVPLRVLRGDGRLTTFLDGVRDRPWIGFKGFSVTIPHKPEALAWAEESASILARSIGAINTLARRNDKWWVYNTDCYAVVDAVCAGIGRRRHELVGASVDILGTGGAARAAVAGFDELGCAMTVYGRNVDRARALAQPYGGVGRPFDERHARSGELLINATNIGMVPDAEASPMESSWLAGCRLVFDMVYRPKETKLLRQARAAGVPTASGLSMFMRQAAAQFLIWTGIEPDVEAGTHHVESILQGESNGMEIRE